MDNVQDDAAPVRKAPGQLQLEDVHILERFYNQLSLLVEAQCPSDPLSLLCVQYVRFAAYSGHMPHGQHLIAAATDSRGYVLACRLRNY